MGQSLNQLLELLKQTPAGGHVSTQDITYPVKSPEQIAEEQAYNDAIDRLNMQQNLINVQKLGDWHNQQKGVSDFNDQLLGNSPNSGYAAQYNAGQNAFLGGSNTAYGAAGGYMGAQPPPPMPDIKMSQLTPLDPKYPSPVVTTSSISKAQLGTGSGGGKKIPPMEAHSMVNYQNVPATPGATQNIMQSIDPSNYQSAQAAVTHNRDNLFVLGAKDKPVFDDGYGNDKLTMGQAALSYVGHTFEKWAKDGAQGVTYDPKTGWVVKGVLAWNVKDKTLNVKGIDGKTGKFDNDNINEAEIALDSLLTNWAGQSPNNARQFTDPNAGIMKKNTRTGKVADLSWTGLPVRALDQDVLLSNTRRVDKPGQPPLMTSVYEPGYKVRKDFKKDLTWSNP